MSDTSTATRAAVPAPKASVTGPTAWGLLGAQQLLDLGGAPIQVARAARAARSAAAIVARESARARSGIGAIPRTASASGQARSVPKADSAPGK